MTPINGIRAVIDQQYLADLRVMIRRGMAGVVREGRSPGSRAYGYRPMVRKPGELEIVEAEKHVVRRIFQEYAEGKTPREIVRGLNADGIAPPRAKAWAPNTLNGHKSRGTGILANELYAGRRVWNRVHNVKAPGTIAGNSGPTTTRNAKSPRRPTCGSCRKSCSTKSKRAAPADRFRSPLTAIERERLSVCFPAFFGAEYVVVV